MSEARHRSGRDLFSLALSPAEMELESGIYPPPWRLPARHSTLRLTNLRTIWSIETSAMSASPAYFPSRKDGEALTGSTSPQLTGGDVNDAHAVGFHGAYDLVQFSTSRSLKDPLVLSTGSGRSTKMNRNSANRFPNGPAEGALPSVAPTGGFPAVDRTKGGRAFLRLGRAVERKNQPLSDLTWQTTIF
jgi:hypothetical protein